MIEIEVQVGEPLDGYEPIHTSGILPDDARKRAVPQVERALRDKLPKLVAAHAEHRILLIELPTIDTSTTVIIDLIRHSPEYAADLASIDFIVLAKSHQNDGAGSVWFFGYDTRVYDLNDAIGCVSW